MDRRILDYDGNIISAKDLSCIYTEEEAKILKNFMSLVIPQVPTNPYTYPDTGESALDILQAFYEMYCKSLCNKELTDLIDGTIKLEEVPLYVCARNEYYYTIANWRLKIGK